MNKKKLRKEREQLNWVTQQLEAYLQLAYEETNDVTLTLKFTDDPGIILSLPLANEHLRLIAGMVYVCASRLRHWDHEITFNAEKGGFKVKVEHYDYPF